MYEIKSNVTNATVATTATYEEALNAIELWSFTAPGSFTVVKDGEELAQATLGEVDWEA